MDLDYVNMNNFPDAEIVARMRKCNYEKFKTLVRMHLSFELDLNTDEFDFPYHEIVYEDKGKLRKWNRMPKKHKHATSTGCASTSKSAGNSPTEGLHQQIDAGFLFHLIELKDFLLLEKNLTQEGIFRKTGSVSRQNELRLQLRNEKSLDLEGGDYSAHDCATIFKGYLADLPEPLLTDAHYPAHLQIAPLCMGTTLNILGPSTSARPPNSERLKREQHLLSSVQLLLLLLPDDNRKLLQNIIEMLHAVANRENSNKMSPENLATLFAPHLICPRNMPPEALHYVSKKMSSIIAYMITKGSEIFLVPSKVATDIRAHFLEQKRKKTMSPEHTLDESISDMSTVNTVYTFVDREKTAAAHTANTTDTELAQLYAHIQSLPESSKKRRLIKQFNKQNGQGTPLQLVLRNRIKNSEASRGAKSIGDSIKKHIFHKGIMMRTPKRSNGAAVMAGIETPIFSNNKNPKMRVLFQSPTPASNATSVAAAPLSSLTNASNSQYAIKMHPLQKSISSSSLLNSTSSSSNFSHHNQDIESSSSNSSDGYAKPGSSSLHSNGTSSAPVSRQTSSELNANSFSIECNTQDPTCCTVTPLKIGPENTKKNVAWHREDLLKINEISTLCTTPTQPSSVELMSRYKSEPNLSHLIKDKLCDAAATPVSKAGKSAFTRKIMKGVSMGNLKFPFSTPESTKRLVRSVSTTLKRRSSDDTQNYLHDVEETDDSADHVLEDVDDHTFEDDPLDSDDGDPEAEETEEEEVFGHITAGGSSSNELPGCSKSMYQQLLLQQGSLYRNLDLITSTPSLLLGRRSMSPITKSTQRMPKAMQESIMTPRSRKPVMVLATALGSSEQNQTIYPTDLSSFREQDEEDSLSGKTEQRAHANILQENNANALGGYPDIFRRRQELLNANQSFVQECAENIHSEKSENTADALDPLTNDFKEYLLSRSVLTASPPVDSSFSSQPDDFGSTQDIEDLDESQLSPSLLYCLDGNQPDNAESKSDESNDEANGKRVEATAVSEIDDRITPNSCLTNRLSTNPFVILNNARKRAATSNGDRCTTVNETTTTSIKSKSTNKENCENVEGYRLSKKFLISEYPGETSF